MVLGQDKVGAAASWTLPATWKPPPHLTLSSTFQGNSLL